MTSTDPRKRMIGSYVGAQALKAVRTGHDNVFGKSSDRKKMTDKEAKEHFVRVWKKTLRPALENADQIPPSLARSMVSVLSAANRVIDTSTHVMDRVQGVICIAQILANGDVDELWFPPASRSKPGVWVEFDTKDEKKEMETLAGDKTLADYILGRLRATLKQRKKPS